MEDREKRSHYVLKKRVGARWKYRLCVCSAWIHQHILFSLIYIVHAMLLRLSCLPQRVQLINSDTDIQNMFSCSSIFPFLPSRFRDIFRLSIYSWYVWKCGLSFPEASNQFNFSVTLFQDVFFTLHTVPWYSRHSYIKPHPCSFQIFSYLYTQVQTLVYLS